MYSLVGRAPSGVPFEFCDIIVFVTNKYDTANLSLSLTSLKSLFITSQEEVRENLAARRTIPPANVGT